MAQDLSRAAVRPRQREATRSEATRGEATRGEANRSEAKQREAKQSDAKRRTKPHRSRHIFSIICFSITRENRTKHALTQKIVAQGSRPHAHHDCIPLESAASQAIMPWKGAPCSRAGLIPQRRGTSQPRRRREFVQGGCSRFQGLFKGLFKVCSRVVCVALLRFALARFASVCFASSCFASHCFASRCFALP
jgi:hypothetical protein